MGQILSTLNAYNSAGFDVILMNFDSLESPRLVLKFKKLFSFDLVENWLRCKPLKSLCVLFLNYLVTKMQLLLEKCDYY